MTDDLVNWLQEYADAVAHYERGDDAILIDLARTRIKALTAENERLRAALEPFASAACDLDNEPDRVEMWEHPVAMNVTAGDFRRARAALGDTQ